ncbi:hypothetical protein SMD44_00925 [Streptomyces alboflavus]|uniref:Uncharacterized protein n=1 Tax=Streptomyces alboflavus TaxID=67267 RepID=A0A1Z1W550_9ACTN|nr:hypothetical protein [Streptomyces alboflavus]ARX81527.1 hypothetical protein SMD44_00925 [Streptomyces alboflavus]
MATAKKPTAKQDPVGAVADRSPDGADGIRHVKEFVVLGAAPAEDASEPDPNKIATLQEAIQRGLHPRGDVRLDGCEEQPDGVSRLLRYSVEVVPAEADEAPERTRTPRQALASGD